MTNAEIVKAINDYIGSAQYERLRQLQELYDADNPDIVQRGADKDRRGKTPNNVIPTGYYSTVVDTMAGYMFQDVQYVCENPELQENLDAINEANNIPVEDMKMGVSALAFNKGIEYVYGDAEANIKIRRLNPLNTIIVQADDIDMTPIAAINFSVINKEENEYSVLYVEPTEERRFTVKGESFSEDETRTLIFDSLPVIDYRSQIIGKKAPFEVIIPYIKGLDALVSGNANEIDRLTEAILILGKVLDEGSLEHMEELKAIMDMSTEDRAEYLTKDVSPEFRKYVSELLIREIHKHSHVIDWYAADQGQTSDASGKALRTRLFDMDMYSKRIEMAYREAAQKRLEAVDKLATPLKQPIGKVKINYHRTMIDDFVDDAVKLSQVTFISDITKREKLNIDEEEEQDRLAQERPEGVIIETEE